MTTPLLSDVGIIALVPERFDVPWMSRHQILTRLAAYFPTVWMNPAPHWRDALARLTGRAEQRPTAAHGYGRAVPPPDGMTVYDPPPWLPSTHRPAFAAEVFDRARLGRARSILVAQGCRQIVLYVWRPVFVDALDRADFDVSLYHVVDEYSFSPVETDIAPEERRLLEEADRVIIHSPALFERKSRFNPSAVRVPNGVDYATASASHPIPADLVDIPGPRIGYSGWIKRQLDWDLIDALTERHPDLSFVFVGARQPDPELDCILAPIEARDNVHFLGAKTPDELLAYPEHFDACVMPYKIDDYTKYIYPLKLHEYLAAGTPVVARPIQTLQDFEGTILLADDADEWSAALQRTISAEFRSDEAVADRRALAKRHDWNRIAYRVAQCIAADVGGDVTDRLRTADVPEAWRCGDDLGTFET